MSESTFRAVVALVLVGALALGIVAVIALLPKSAEPEPGRPTASPPTPLASPAVATTPIGPAFGEPSVVGVGLVERGTESGSTLRFELVESDKAAIPRGPGSLDIAITDGAGDESTVAFTGAPDVAAPGSLGITVVLAAPNVLRVSIVDSDTFNVEAIRISGLGIRASSSAALGPVSAEIRDPTGSLSMPFSSGAFPSLATVVAAP